MNWGPFLAVCGLVTLLVFAGGVALGLAWGRRRQRQVATPPAADSIDAAVARERERIHADLHDDLGAKLLELVYRAPDPQFADTARAALMDLRDVVSRSRGSSGTLLETLSEIELEASRRLDLAGITLDWQQPQDIGDRPLDRAQSLHLFRIVREAVSNVIRHAGAARLTVHVHPSRQALRLELTDDGAGLQAVAGAGAGTAGMRARAAQLQGNITWRGATAGGTRVILTLPLAD